MRADRYLNAEVVDLDFTASDGTRLKATAYVPSEPRPGFAQETRFGAVVAMSPWYAALGGDDTDNLMDGIEPGKLNESYLFGLLVSRGFVYVAASTPGTANSSGCYDYGGVREQSIIAQFVDWVAEQPFANGNVGMGGGYWAGAAQWMAAIQQPAHLRTIVPRSPYSDVYGYVYADGVPYVKPGPYVPVEDDLWASYGISDDPSVAPRLMAAETLATRLCPGVADHARATAEAAGSGQYDEFWQERDYLSRLGDVRASVFLVQDLASSYSKPNQGLVWDGLHVEKRVWLQQLGDSSLPYLAANQSRVRDDFNATLVAWYDHYLNGADNGIPDALPPVQVQDQTGFWRNETRWPPATQAHTYYLDAGALQDEPGTTASRLVGAPSSAVISDPDAPEQVVARFLTDPMDSPLHLSGVPVLELKMNVGLPGYSRVVAQLWRVHDDEWELLSFGGRGLAQREGREANNPPTPLVNLQVPVAFQALDAYLESGDRLAVTISQDNPWFLANLWPVPMVIESESTLTLPELPPQTPRGWDTANYTAQNPYWRP